MFVQVLAAIEEVSVSVDSYISSSSFKAAFHPHFKLAALTCCFYSFISLWVFCTAVVMGNGLIVIAFDA